MHVIRARNVNIALITGLRHLAEVGQPQASRAGDVIVSPYPVTIVYDCPTERVLLWPARDANPFFHIFEALWMLRGRNDVAFLNRFIHDFGARFSDNGSTIHGAYGHRWRCWPTALDEHKDQLARVIQYLRRFPDGRRAVLQMWDPDRDLYAAEVMKDVPCNQNVMFRVGLGKRDEPNRLNMMVTCRSGDLVWGICGANAVHFSILQEYVAAHLGLVVGTFTHVVNNLHAYASVYDKLRVASTDELLHEPPDPYTHEEVTSFPMIEDTATWGRDLALFMEAPSAVGYMNQWFSRVAKPLWFSHQAWRKKDYEAAFYCANECLAPDWRRAAVEWIERRKR